MTALPRLTGLGPVADGRRSGVPRSLAGPSALATAAPLFALDAAAMVIDRSARREHMRITIPFSGPSPRRAQDDINQLLRASMSDNGSLERLRAVHLEIDERAIVLSAAGAAHAVEHWLDGTRLTDAVLAAIVGAARAD